VESWCGLICISFMARDAEHFLSKNFVHFICPFLPLDYWFFGHLGLWAPCKFMILIPFQFFSHSLGCLLSLVTISFPVQKLISFISPIYPSCLFIAEPLKLYLGSCCLCLHVPVYSLFFPILVWKFQILY
jgi:hypothetical protein